MLRGLSCCSASAGCTRFATGATGNWLHAQGLAGSAKINLSLFSCVTVFACGRCHMALKDNRMG